jgi:dipeptidyl aminopeptidase/acylaminoacyl peptidase
MPSTYEPFSPTQPPVLRSQKRSSPLKWILGILGGLLLLVVIFCGGGLWWALSYPSVTAEAKQPFNVDAVPRPDFKQAAVEDLPASNGVTRRLVTFGDGSGFGSPPGSNMRLIIYLPRGARPDQTHTCVLIGGAGSRPFEGMLLGEGDEPEHEPYAEAGMVVVAFDIDGPEVGEDSQDLQRAYLQFRASQAGMINARNALEYALQHVPEVDPQKIYIAGHSSAACLALLYAEHESRLAGCIAFAPAPDKSTWIPAPMVRMLAMALPELPTFLVRSSAVTHAASFQCPLFLFHAADDSTVSVEESRRFSRQLQAAGKQVEYREVATGDHYDAMVDQGIPAAIEWLRAK